MPWWGHDRGHVVDGGYFENSGTVAALELVNALRQLCGTACAGRIHMIYLRNSPVTDPRAVIDPGNPDQTLDRSSTEAEEADENEKDLDPFSTSYPRLNELLSPPRALMNTRGARGSLAVKTAVVEMARAPNVVGPKEEKGGGKQGGRATESKVRRFFEIGLCESVEDPEQRGEMKRAPLPLGWQLSGASRKAMDQQLTAAKGCRTPGNARTLEAIAVLLMNGDRATARAEESMSMQPNLR